MCKTTSAGVRPRPLLRQVQVQVPLGPPTDEEKKAVASSLISFPLGLPFSPPSLSSSIPYQNAFVQPPSSSMPMSLPPMQTAAPSVPAPGATSGSHKQRMVRPACVNCRRSKVRCEGGIPCKRCLRLGLDHSCQRCQPKKRGRKRKPQDEMNREAAKSGQAVAPSADSVKRLKVTRPSLPARSAEEVARDAVEQFVFLNTLFRRWREKLTSDPNTDKVALSRFLYFCSYLSHVVKDYMDSHPPSQQQVLSDWLCSSLAEDVHKFVENVGNDIVSFPQVSAAAADNSPASVLQLNVEKQVFKQMPLGAAMLSLHPYPFHQQEKAWVNDNMSTLLGYEREHLKAIFSDRDAFFRALHPSCFNKFIGQFWDAIAEGRTHYAVPSKWLHQNGEEIDLNGTFSIKYKNGLPIRWTMFLQASPKDLERLQSMESLSETVVEQLVAPDSVSSPDMDTKSASSPDTANQHANTFSFSAGTPIQTPLDGCELNVVFPHQADDIKSDTPNSLSLDDSTVDSPNAPLQNDDLSCYTNKPFNYGVAAPARHYGWVEQPPADSTVLDMLLAQQPELEFS